MSVPARDPIFGHTVLAAAADWTEPLAQRHVHAAYAPVAVLTLVHTLRVSHGARMLSGGKNSRLGLFQSVVLDQIVLFAGSSVLALALGQPLPVLLAPFAIALYSGVHVAATLSGLGDVLLELHAHPLAGLAIDMVVCAVDALVRTEGIVNVGFGMLAAHRDARFARALSAKLFAGALISGATPLVAQAFHLSSATGAWVPKLPAWAHDPAYLVLPDVVAGVLAALVHAVLTQGVAVRTHGVLAAAAHALGVHAVPKAYAACTPYLAPREAKVVAAAVLFVVLAVPALIRRVPQLVPRRRATTRTSGRRSTPRAPRVRRGLKAE